MLRPLGDRIVASPIDLADKVKRETSAIMIPDSVANTAARNREFRMGRVLGVGPKTKDIKPGDTVLWRKFTGTECKVHGETVWILNGDEILGLVDDAEG